MQPIITFSYRRIKRTNAVEILQHRKFPCSKLNNVHTMLIRSAVLCNDAPIVKNDNGEYFCIGDPTEGSLTTLGMKAGMERGETMLSFPRETELPFDSDRKLMTTYHSGITPDKWVAFTKGAPDVVFSRCSKYLDVDGEHDMTPEYLEKIREANLSRPRMMREQKKAMLSVIRKKANRPSSCSGCPGTACLKTPTRTRRRSIWCCAGAHRQAYRQAHRELAYGWGEISGAVVGAHAKRGS